MKTWVVVADSAVARVMAADKPGAALAEIHQMENQNSRMHERELTSDLPGRAFDSGGMGRHVMTKQVEPKKQEAIRFAKDVVSYLEAGRNSNSFEKLYVVAAPEFLGLMRDGFSDATSRMIASTIDKNLVSEKVDAIRSRLPKFL